MTDEQLIQAYAQSIYLVRADRYFEDIGTTTEGAEYIAQVIDYTNQLLDEIEVEADWNYLREQDLVLGTIASPTQTFALPSDVRKLIVNEDRPLVIMQDGTIVSSFDVVDPNQISNPRDHNTKDRVTVVNGTILFSRPLTEIEQGGAVMADVLHVMPRLATDDATLLSLVKPKQLLVLGVAKNATLPNIIQGGISPSLTQKYGDLLEKAVAENNATAASYYAGAEDYSYIGGLY